MKCLDEGLIQAYIDRELEKAEIKGIEEHLLECANCKERYRELLSVNNYVEDKISNYKEAFDLNKETSIIYNKKGVLFNMKKYKNYIVAASLVLVVATCVTVKPIRAAISDMVSIFRIQEIKSINISLDDINQLRQAIEKHESNIDIDKIGKVNYQGGERETVTLEAASNMLSYEVLLPEKLSQADISNVSVSKPSKLDFTLNVNNINQVLETLGEKIAFPAELDGKTFSLRMEGKLDIDYNTKDGKYISIVESRVPEILAPAGVSIDDLYSALSDLSILPQDIQAQLKTIKDWKSALYIPNINNQLEEININGSKAVYNEENGHSTILVLKDGILVSIYGNIPKTEMLEIVKSLR